VRRSGIGGTGVVTVSQLIGTAALLDGYEVRGLDQTGLSQKAGPVVSDLRLSRSGPTPSSKATVGSIDTLLAFDALVAASDSHLAAASTERTVVVASTSVTPTGSMVAHPTTAYPGAVTLQGRLDARSRPALNRYVDAAAACRELFGSTTAANVFLLGVAVQAGTVPLSVEALERAVELNGVAVAANLAALRAGRQWIVDAASRDDEIGGGGRPVDEVALADRLATELAAYQNASYAERFRAVVAKVANAESAVSPGSRRLADTAARHLFQFMAYKDEYEVARLLLAPEAKAAAEAVGGKGAKVRWHLHPPMLRSLGMRRKLRLGPWAKPLLIGLRAGRRLRGTALDPFGVAKVRRVERHLVTEYEATLDRLLAGLDSSRLDEAVRIAGLADTVRGYEHLKLARASAYQAETARALDTYDSAAPSRP
jgi:indolepyruvate ferredoxin oxidoreductase